jgi:TPR repeat protein
MKKYLFCMTLLLSGAAYADDLADANALFAKKSYPQALQLYTKLANGGNAEAQLHMGEMYLYGEAGAVDVAKAESWFKKSAAKGNKTAVGALAMMKQREARKADLDFWMSKYDGAELKTGQYSCPAPRLPAMSKQNEEIAAVAAKVQAWQTCYNAFVVHLNAAAPLTKLIPKDVADLLTKDEMAVATSHLEGVYTSLVEEARVSSKLFLADYAAWRDATDAYVGNHNQMLNDAAAAAKQRKN